MQNVPKPVNGKRLLTAIACVAIFTVMMIASSCKKDKDKGVIDRLQNKWSLVQIVDSFYSSSSLAPMVTPYEGQPGEYIEFRPDGRRCSYIKKAYDTIQYTFSEKNFNITVLDHNYNILILTDNTMILHEPHYSATPGSNDYSAYRITLKR